ncbi:MAG: cyclic nucleotide-binding domain-containing protein, partial [Candidatus Lambdaproteobacteria bacterium]|nr:cyclic nucleotide-binding domain-containing protein [Candidatus Lambdaproteobacteria bacterium]
MSVLRGKELAKNPELLEHALGVLIEARYFQTMTADILREVLREGTYLKVPKGRSIISEAQTDDDVYFLLDGSLAVSSGSKFILRLNTPGDIAGEFAVVSSTPRSADVVAESDAELVRISSSIVKKAQTDDPVRAVQFLTVFGHIMAAKLRETSQRAKLYEDAVMEAREIASSHAELESEIDDKLQEILL